MFYRSTTLSPSHYAGKWVIPDEDQRYDLKVVNQLGYEYATEPDSDQQIHIILDHLSAHKTTLMRSSTLVRELDPAMQRSTIVERCIAHKQPRHNV